MKIKTKSIIYAIGIIAVSLTLSVLIVNEYHYVPFQPVGNDSLPIRPVCSIDTNEVYHTMWEKLFLDHNQIREEYYNNHITVVGISTVI